MLYSQVNVRGSNAEYAASLTAASMCTRETHDSMIGLETARKLKQAGLAWRPAQGDRFVMPDLGMDDVVFVINDMATIIERIRGAEVVTFHGTPEWALDYVYLGEAVWLPEEGQLRDLLQSRMVPEGEAVYDLLYADGVYTCRFAWRDTALAFTAGNAADAYATALLHLMETEA